MPGHVHGHSQACIAIRPPGGGSGRLPVDPPIRGERVVDAGLLDAVFGLSLGETVGACDAAEFFVSSVATAGVPASVEDAGSVVRQK
ncbi:hypothetical protein EFB14_32505 [Rhizobium fabae]|uniref:Uncharacterized protein n=1 Tax=Rhizobium fabae TaxID=573179 RepID=A0ABY0AZI6_9HYPH|nr:hypothetical protein EFB14_32505 [Rhizobium fabae]